MSVNKKLYNILTDVAETNINYIKRKETPIIESKITINI